MKRILTLFVFFVLFISARAQNDVSVIAITSPVSACAMTATENVTIRIFNFGSNLPAGTTMNVSYTINAGGPVTELLTLGSTLLSNSTLNYTFTTQANLSVAGTYTLTATTALAGDINTSNDAFTGYTVTNTAPSVGGVISGGTNVCISGNSGVLTLSGHTGSVLRWEYSVDGGSTWVNISNNTTTQAYSNLTIPTQYRAVVQNGGCTSANSAVASMTINPASVGGTLSSSATVCSGINSGTLSLSGRTGSIVRWEFSIDGGLTWTNIANTTSTQSYTNLVTTTRYRVLVQSGACASVYSNFVNITVSPATVGGSVNPAATTVCSGSNSGTLTLSGHTGSIIRWEFSIDGGLTWNNITNTTTTQTYTNLIASRLYRARIQSSPCSVVYSSIAAVTVTTASVGGTVTPVTSSACTGANSGTLTLSGHTGSVVQWEASTDGGLTWNIIANTTTTENYTNLTQTTLYRALVQNGGCTASYSSTGNVNVNPVSVGGTVSGGVTVCASSNSGILNLSGETGSIIQWESSTDQITWTSTGNSTSNQSFNNLSDTTFYRVIIQSGVCPTDTSVVDTVIVDPVTVGGVISPASNTACSGINSGVLTLSAETGNVVQWEYSTDGGITWIIISNTATTQSYNNIITATIYRALVQSGVCSQAYSAQATVSVNPQAVGGTLYSDATVCGGSNSGILTLVGFSGTINNWESSSDGGLTWTNIANTTINNSFLNIPDTTIYRVIISGGVCPNDTSTQVTIYTNAPSVGGTLSMDDTVCGGANSGTLTLSGHTGNVSGWEYSTDGGVTWINISNTTTSQGYLNLMQTTMYRARVGNGVCPSVPSDTAIITVSPATVPGTISGSAATCEGSGSGVLTLSGNNGTILGWESSTDGISWTPIANTGSTENWSNPADTTYYHVIVLSSGCPADTSSNAIITVYAKPVAAFTSTTVCEGNSTVFTDATTIAAGGILFHSWTFGDNDASVAASPLHTYNAGGTYNVSMIVVSDHNCSDTATGTVTVNALPSATITAAGNLTLCAGDSVMLSVAAAPQNHYLWNTTDSVNAIYASLSGNYLVTVTDTVTGCFASDSVDLLVLPSPTALAGPDTAVSAGSSIVLLGNGGAFYSWSPSVGLSDPNAANPVCTPPYSVTYTLTVTDMSGCSDTDAVVVTFEKDFNVIISNMITANGDGFNDVWNIQNISFYPENRVTVYNRNGMLVYEAESYNNSWNGTFNGEQLPDGTYYYVLEFTDTGDVLKGAVTIISEKK